VNDAAPDPACTRSGLCGATVALAVMPRRLSAQATPRSARVAYLSAAVPGPIITRNMVEPFVQALSEAGFVEGRNLTIDQRFAEGKPERLPRLLAELLALKPDLIVAVGPAPALAAKAATTTVPIVAAPVDMPWMFLVGNFLIGAGGALFGHGTLTATMNRSPKEQAGLALGAWGAVQATGAGLGIALSGTIRDLVNAALGAFHGPWGLVQAANGYMVVYVLEIVLLLLTIAAIAPLTRRTADRRVEPTAGFSVGSDFAPAAPCASDPRGSPAT